MCIFNDSKIFLKTKGLKYTKGREAVLNVLTNSNLPMSYDEIYLKLNTNEFNINISTIYRILETFCNVGIASKISGGKNGRFLYVLKHKSHTHYFFCVKCEKMYPIPDCPLEKFLNKFKNDTNFDIINHSIELTGTCNKCKYNNK